MSVICKKEKKEGFDFGIDIKIEVDVSGDIGPLFSNTKTYKIKQEPTDYNNYEVGEQSAPNIKIKEEIECTQHNNWVEGSSLITKLYKGHEVKEEIVIGPTVLVKREPSATEEQNATNATKAYSNNPTEKSGAFVCNMCQEVFQKPRRLEKHIRKIHKRNKKRICKICYKSFDKKRLLKQHLLTHTGEGHYVCDVCGRMFSHLNNLKQHILVNHTILIKKSVDLKQQHKRDKLHSCKICSKSFKVVAKLDIHMRVHTGVKPYSCSYCDKQFSQKESFKVHERTHTGEKPYSCNYCDRKFARKDSFQLHERTHTGEKPFSCNMCNRKFAHKFNLRQHKRTHTGEKRFSCRFCDMQFARKTTFQRHEKIHTGEKPYLCHFCLKRYARKDVLKLHERSHHNMID